ncbi:hypothetical protein [Aeromicrobium sp. Leaf350]|uniref:hypothetical protein n=1 Tax=Aeromicrobium sp. Leaf350 TaxID=2876565 RepID=UPI001E62254D|nr:hypothetical protein [Aeromicrobium sp. Leaf350]
MTGWRFLARIAAGVLLVAVVWTGFTTLGEAGGRDCGNAFAPDYSAAPDAGSLDVTDDSFDEMGFAQDCRDDVATRRFVVLVLAIAGTGMLAIGVSSQERLGDDAASA